MSALLVVDSLSKRFVVDRNAFGVPRQYLDAVRDVSFTLDAGRTIGIVGESGAGKSTVGRLVLRLIEPDGGSVKFNGADIVGLNRRDVCAMRAKARMVFQDPFSSLDPRMLIGDAVAEPMKIHGIARGPALRQRTVELLGRVGISERQLDRYPYEFSGGQLQRVAVARAIATDPDLVVCDEPVAALDMSIRAQVVNLLCELQAERGMAYVFVSHDLSLVRLIADSVAVMFRGAIVEYGSSSTVFGAPKHPYTKALLEAVPVPDPSRRQRPKPALDSEPQPDSPPPSVGCEYAGTCTQVFALCHEERPPLLTVDDGVAVACHLHAPKQSDPAALNPQGHSSD